MSGSAASTPRLSEEMFPVSSFYYALSEAVETTATNETRSRLIWLILTGRRP